MSDTPTSRTFKALFTDLDGTAMPSHPEASPSPKVIEAVAKAQAKILVSVATGRPYSMCKEILQQLKIENPCIVEGGSQIRDPKTHDILWEQTLSRETMNEIEQICRPYVFKEDGEDVKAFVAHEPIFKGTRYMMVILGLPENEALLYGDKLRKLPEVQALKVQSWVKGKWDLHISHIGASKRHALEVLLGMLKLDAQDVIGIGDSHNDLPLFEASGFKVAMGNAVQDLKDKADYIAPTVGEDGLAHVIEKFVTRT